MAGFDESSRNGCDISMGLNRAYENYLRPPHEFIIAFVAFGFGLLVLWQPSTFFLTNRECSVVALIFFTLSGMRFIKAWKILSYRHGLLKQRAFFKKIVQLPKRQDKVYLGKGFQWLPIHRQRLHLLSQIHNQHYLKPSWFQNFFSPKILVGGKPWIHGIGANQERATHLQEESRKGNTVVFGETGVGKSQLESLIVAQDILKGQAVLVIDPKGDLSLAQHMYAACQRANRLDDFYMLHAGIPQASAKYNPLENYTHIGEVATRITSAISAEGEGKTFQDFAWKFLNTTAIALKALDEAITYQSLAFFVIRPRQLLMNYCDRVLPDSDPDYNNQVDQLIRSSIKLNKSGKPSKPMTREEAVRQYVATHITTQIQQGDHQSLQDSLIIDLYDAAQLGEEYYRKITASLLPVFDKINKTAAGDIFSWYGQSKRPVLNLEKIIKNKQVVYICLDAQSNRAMSEAVGRALIADLVSLCGRLYKEQLIDNQLLYLHADEFSDIVQDDFITLLNKARGAGVRVTAYTQTMNDLGAAFGSNKDKSKMLLGNFSNMIMMRIGNLDTAQVFTECLQNVQSRSTTPSTMTYDKSDNHQDDLFTTSNTDVVNEHQSKIIVENDLFSLPKGQAFMLTNGGELYKIRIPLLTQNSKDSIPNNFFDLMLRVNLCKLKQENKKCDSNKN